MTRRTIGAWLPAMVAKQCGVSRPVARAMVGIVLDAVADDLARAVPAMADADMVLAGRILVARAGYARDRAAPPGGNVKPPSRE